jgi:hypothetical protein
MKEQPQLKTNHKKQLSNVNIYDSEELKSERRELGLLEALQQEREDQQFALEL